MRKRRLLVFFTIILLSAAMAVPCFAEDPVTPTIGETIGTTLTPVKIDALGALTAIAPVAICIMGAFLVWRFGVKFFKRLAK